MVVASAVEPAIVEDVALDADAGREIGEIAQPADVVVEVDGLPDVEVDRPRCRRVGGQRAQIAVECGGEPVQSLRRCRDVDPRSGVRLVLGEDQLTGQQQLAATDRGRAFGQPLEAMHVVAAPSDMHPPDLAVPEAEASRATHEQSGRVVARAATTGLAQPQAVGDRSSLGEPLGVVATREVETLGRTQGRGERRPRATRRRTAAASVLVSVCRARTAPPGDRLDLGAQSQPRCLVRRVDRTRARPRA